MDTVFAEQVRVMFRRGGRLVAEDAPVFIEAGDEMEYNDHTGRWETVSVVDVYCGDESEDFKQYDACPFASFLYWLFITNGGGGWQADVYAAEHSKVLSKAAEAAGLDYPEAVIAYSNDPQGALTGWQMLAALTN